MKQKVILYLTDEDLFLYKGASEKPSVFQGSFEEIRPALERQIDSKASLSFLIDRSHQDIYEEKLPPLFLWDRWRFLFHKKMSCSAQGGYAGFQFLREGKDLYLRWAHIVPNDSLAPWIAWIFARSGQVFFVALEGRGLLQQHFPSLQKYHMLLYPLPSQKMRHVIFKGRRLLLSRFSQTEEESKASLHFLSRTHPDIHENLSMLSLIEKPEELRCFIVSRKKPSFLLCPASFSTILWRRWGGGIFLLAALAGIGFEVYQGVVFKNKTMVLAVEIKSLELLSKSLKSPQDVVAIKVSLEHYALLKAYRKSPLKDFEQLAVLLKAHPVHLEHIKWHHEQQYEIDLTFLIESNTREMVITQFEALLASTRAGFPKSHLHVLEAPFNSSFHETFKSSSETASPRAHIKIVMP